MGNFNEIISQFEKGGCNPINWAKAKNFLNYINYCGLIDLGFKEIHYTWSNHRYRSGLIVKRLDRCLSNLSWSKIFPNTTVTHLHHTYANHFHIHVKLDNVDRRNLDKIFCLENIWCNHPEFKNIVSYCQKNTYHCL